MAATTRYYSGDITASGQFNGSGLGLTSHTVPRASIATDGSALNYIVSNDGSGNLTSVNYVPLAHGGTNASLTPGGAGTDNVIVLVGGGTAASLVRYSTTAVANSLVQRDGSGGFTMGSTTYTPSVTFVTPTTECTQIGDNRVTTSNAAATTLFTVPLNTSENFAALIDVKIIAGTTTGATAAFQMMWKAKNISGTVTVGATFASKSVDIDALIGTVDAAVSPSGTDVLVTVTGILATTIQWGGHCSVTYKSLFSAV